MHCERCEMEGDCFVEKKKVRFSLTVPDDIAKRAEELKKESYYNTSYSEMYRKLIELGLKEIEKQKGNEDDN